MNNKEFDKTKIVEILATALKRKRKDGNLSLKDAADESGITKSTLSRIENLIGKPDAETIARLTDYLDLPTDAVWNQSDGGAVSYHPRQSTPDIIAAHLSKDRHLTSRDAQILSELFRTAYEQFTNLQNKGNENGKYIQPTI